MGSFKITDKLPKNYNPLEDKKYMSPYMLCYFRNKLESMLSNIISKENEISHSLMDRANKEADHVDQGINEELQIQDFAFQEHEEVMKKEVLDALERLNKGTYGYCQETSGAIGVKRLLSVPTARYRVDIQADYEKNDKYQN